MKLVGVSEDHHHRRVDGDARLLESDLRDGIESVFELASDGLGLATVEIGHDDEMRGLDP